MQVFLLVVLLIGSDPVVISSHEELDQCELKGSEYVLDGVHVACVPDYYEEGWMASFLRGKEWANK